MSENNAEEYTSLQYIITKYHDPNLVHPDESPNGNWIYHIYSDGEVTHQKGGFAYLRRSEFIEKSPIYGFKSNLVFPMKGSTHSYAIVTKEHANLIRKEMIKETEKTNYS